jgi:[ribosomal protein S5]-alanine N-acetyltransferase
MKKILTIRQATEADLRSILLFEFRNRAWFARFIPYQVLRRQTEHYFKQLLRGQLNTTVQYLVCLPNDVLIGRFTVQMLDRKKRSVEISYRVAKHFSNRGVAQYTLKHVLLILDAYGIKEVYAQVANHNKASINVLMACGFEFHEIQMNAINLASKVYDGLIFRWVPGEAMPCLPIFDKARVYSAH